MITHVAKYFGNRPQPVMPRQLAPQPVILRKRQFRISAEFLYRRFLVANGAMKRWRSQQQFPAKNPRVARRNHYVRSYACIGKRLPVRHASSVFRMALKKSDLPCNALGREMIVGIRSNDVLASSLPDTFIRGDIRAA